MKQKNKETLSIVIPVYNGAATIAPLVRTVLAELKERCPEVILVNDGSRDDSEDICAELARAHREVTLISLRRNFGEHNAVMCGLNYAVGDYVAIIDDDFQNPPLEIIKLYEEAQKGYDVVYAQYREKKHPLLRNLGSWINDKAANYLLKKPRDLYLSSFKVIRRNLVKEIIKYQGPYPYIDGLILRATDNIGKVWVEHRPRLYGQSNYTFKKLVSLYLNMFLNFSVLPLRIFTITGAIMFFIGLLLAILFVVEKIINPGVQRGWTSMAIMILAFSGFQTMFLGLIGEYLGKQYLSINGSPQWVIKKVVSAGIKYDAKP